MNLEQIKKSVDLRAYAADHYNVRVGQGNKASCPFHPPDKNASFSIFKGNDGTWRWKCHHEGIGGSIVDLKARIEGLTEKEAIGKLRDEFTPGRQNALASAPTSIQPPSAPKQALEIAREHVYVDTDGQPVFKKIKYKPNPLKITWAFLHHDENGWQSGKGSHELIPYHLDRFKDHDRVIICEGEKDADTVNGLSLGLFATSAPTGCSSWLESITPYFAQFQEVVFLYDVGADQHVLRHAAKLKAAHPKLTIKIAKVPGAEPNFDITDYLGDMEGKADALQEILAQAQPFAVIPKPEPPIQKQPDPSVGVLLAERSADSVKIRPIPWLWQGVIPTHMATALTGDAGQGKSLVAIDATGRMSSGTAFPVYDKPSAAVRGHVFYITSEGVPEMILVPRLKAAGADLSKVTIIEGVYQNINEFSMFDITRNLPEIERRARDFPDLKLIVVDPIASFLPEKINTNQGNQVRQAMDRISGLAFKLGLACLVVMHFAKNPSQKAIHRTSGSVQFEASVKMSWSVIRREGDPKNARLLVPQKSNITSGHKSLSFVIQGVEFPTPDNLAEIVSTAKIIYGKHVDEDPETLISPPVETDGNLPRAIEFLKQKMKAGGKLHSGEMIEEAESEGIPRWSLNKARYKLGLKAAKSEFRGGWIWYVEREKA